MTKRIEYKWVLVIMLWLAFFLNQGDRQVYNSIIPFLESDLGLSSVQTGLVATVFAIVYGCFVPIGGYVGDILSRKWIVVGSLLVFSIGTLLTGFANGLFYLIVIRGVTTGLGEAFYYPAATSLLTQHHNQSRATAMSIHQTANYSGVLVSSFVAPFIANALGWRFSFLTFGIFGVVVSVWLIFSMKDTPQIKNKEEKLPFKIVVKGIFSKKTIWLLAIAFGCQVFVLTGVYTWSAKFFNMKFFGAAPETLSKASLVFMLLNCGCAFLGALLGGKISDKLAVKHKMARMRIEYLSLMFGVPMIVLIGLASNLYVALVGVALYGLARGVYDSNLYAAMFDVIDPKLRASSIGVMTAFAFIVGSAAPIYLGFVQGSGNDISAFGLGIASLAGIFLLGSLSVMTAAKFTFNKDFYHE